MQHARSRVYLIRWNYLWNKQTRTLKHLHSKPDRHPADACEPKSRQLVTCHDGRHEVEPVALEALFFSLPSCSCPLIRAAIPDRNLSLFVTSISEAVNARRVTLPLRLRVKCRCEERLVSESARLLSLSEPFCWSFSSEEDCFLSRVLEDFKSRVRHAFNCVCFLNLGKSNTAYSSW